MNKKSILLIIGILFTGATSFLIQNGIKEEMNSKEMFEEESIGKADDPYARMEFERKMLADPATGMIPANIREKELAFSANLPKVEDYKLSKTSSIETLTWLARGPINRGGRTRALGIDVRTQTAPNITIIAAGASGGIYKSTDNGATWVNKLSADKLHSATSIAQDTRTGFEDNWYIGTGERGSNLIGGNGFPTLYLGDGIYKSTNNGDTWALLTSTSNGNPQSFSQAFDFVFNVTVNKATGSVFAAASNTIQRSTNGGTAWTTVRGSLANNAYTDVQSTSTGVIYAAIQYNVTNPGIARSTDDGANWTNITPSTWPSAYTRTVIGIAPSNENIVYFWTYTGAGTTGTQFWKYTYPGSGDGSGDGNWTNLTANLPAPTGDVAGTNVQSAYDMIIKVKPDDENFVILGGTNLYRSIDGFSTAVSATGSTGWMGGYAVANNISQYANHHPDQHSMVFLNSDQKILYSGHDGGISRTSDVTASSVTWTDLNDTYVTSQFYSIAIDKVTKDSKIIAGGLQDNGNYITFSDVYTTDWTDWGHGGDGGYAAVADGNAFIYLEAQNGWLWRQSYNAAGAKLTDNLIEPAYTGKFQFLNPFVLDPNDNDIMYFAQGDSVLRNNSVTTASNQDTWNVLTNATSGGGDISALGISKSTANRLYVGGSNGKVLRIDGANTGDPSATDLTAALTTAGAAASSYVSCIAVDPTNADKVIVVYSNYKVKSIFASDDGGTTWSDVSGNLEQNPDGSGNGPSTRWIDAIIDGALGGSTTFYCATSTGLYSTSTLNGTSTVWTQEGSSVIGNSVCAMVNARSVDGLVAVATHGSGVFSAKQTLVGIESDEGNIPNSYSLSQNYPNPFNPSTQINFSLPSSSNVKLTIYDITGKRVREVLNNPMSAGEHTVNFDASNLSSGTYIYRIQASNYVQSKKMVLLK
ncbi:MAG TPA: T9SS type A sorting domain-containing protein [Ignavibacteriaceae bacterium]|nr:T9SS type A sorting domain-containing protein [Ignavibacteriaceae bacterium]